MTTQPTDLQTAAAAVLAQNDAGTYTMPGPNLYPHQWLWDSCFTAIGLRWLDVDRAKLELTSLLRGQWHNGMLPNMIFAPGRAYHTDRNVWRSWVSPQAPDGIATSGITQPPMLAEAVFQVGQKLPLSERRLWYKQMLPSLVAYHEWLYVDRNPHQEGLVVLLHPWESGMDNSPAWMHHLHEHGLPTWVSWLEKTKLISVVNNLRRDTQFVEPGQRFAAADALALFDAQLRLRRKAYDTDRILDRGLFAIEDLGFNAIFIRSNQILQDMAHVVRFTLPEPLLANMAKTAAALEELWDPYANQYYSRNFINRQLLKRPTIASLLPLYAGCISKERAAMLVATIENEGKFGPAFPLPSVPLDSTDFDPERYWQGPTWLNLNWLIIDGLRRYGYHDHADALTENSLEMVAKAGFAEYFDPIHGDPLGAADFSWTAALSIDLVNR